MQNLTESERNLSAFECGLCLHSPIFLRMLVPFGLISLPANGLVLWLMKSSPVFWTDRMEVFEFHLVLTELLIGLLQMTIIFYITPTLTRILIKFADIALTARIQFQSAICVERYLAVVHPVLYLKYKPLRYRMSCSCFVWLQTILIGTGYIMLCSENPISVRINIASFVYVCILNSYCCLSVLRALKRPSPGEGAREGSNLIKKRAFNMVLLTLVTTFFSYVPLSTVLLLIGRIDQDTVCILHPLAFCTTIWLGVIYTILQLRKALKHKGRNYLCVNCFRE